MSWGDRSHRRALVGGLAVVAVVTALAGATAAADALDRSGTGVVPAAGTLESPGGAVEEPETDNTVTYVTVHEDGTAEWRVTVRTRLSTDESVEAYEAFQERFRGNRSSYRAEFREPMVRVVAAASNATGRSMVATNFTAATSVQTVPRRWGIVTYAFSWEKFAYREGDALRVGDAFESGFFIAHNDTLRLQAPDGYEFASIEPQPDSRSDRTAVWDGRVDFGAGEPAATMRPATAESDPDGTAGGADGGESGSGGDGGDGTADDGGLLGRGPLVALAASAVAAAGALAWYRRRDDASPPPAAENGVDEDGAPADAPAAHQDPPEPLTDGERVRRIVRDHGGRMRQADIVDEVDWSKSKVSRVLGDLADDDVVEKTRIGRENVISLVEDGADDPLASDDD